MRRQSRSQGIDAAIAGLASRQHGVAAREQLLALGLSQSAIDRRVRSGRLLLLHRGVYAVGHVALRREGRWLAAVLAGGSGAVLSHRPAGALWGLLAWQGTIEVIAPAERRSRAGVRYRHVILSADEITTHDAIPVTTVPRTLLDLAAVLPPHRLERAVHEAEVLRLTDPLSLSDLLARHPGRRGNRALREATHTPPSHTRSELEARFLSFLAQFGLPRPRTNVQAEGHEVDCLWPRARLIAELDGHAVHHTRRAFERDRARDRALTSAGWRVIRVTWRQLRNEREALARDLRRLLVLC